MILALVVEDPMLVQDVGTLLPRAPDLPEDWAACHLASLLVHAVNAPCMLASGIHLFIQLDARPEELEDDRGGHAGSRLRQGS